MAEVMVLGISIVMMALIGGAIKSDKRAKLEEDEFNDHDVMYAFYITVFFMLSLLIVITCVYLLIDWII